MMKKIMKDKNVNTLEELIKSAMDNGVKIVACTMSMDVMGIKPEELIEGVEREPIHISSEIKKEEAAGLQTCRFFESFSILYFDRAAGEPYQSVIGKPFEHPAHYFARAGG